jgi:hypothetical protein
MSGASNSNFEIRARSSGALFVSIRSGQANALAIGMRMSGDPSCASVERSTYSTIEWITDCG